MRDMYYAPAHYDYYQEEWRFYLRHGQGGDSKESGGYSGEYGSGSKHSGGYSRIPTGSPYVVTSGGYSTGSYSGGSSSYGSHSGPDDRHPPEWVFYLQNRHLMYSLASYYGYILDDHESSGERPPPPDNTCPLMTDLDRWWISLTHPPREPEYSTGPPPVYSTGPPPGYHDDPFKPPYAADIMGEWDLRYLRCTRIRNDYDPYAPYTPLLEPNGDVRCPPYWFEKMPDIPELEFPPRKHEFALPYYVNLEPDPKPTIDYRPPPPPPRPSPTKPHRQEEALYVLTPLYGWQYVYIRDGYPYPGPPHNYTTGYPYSTYPTGEIWLLF